MDDSERLAEQYLQSLNLGEVIYEGSSTQAYPEQRSHTHRKILSSSRLA